MYLRFIRDDELVYIILSNLLFLLHSKLVSLLAYYEMPHLLCCTEFCLTKPGTLLNMAFLTSFIKYIYIFNIILKKSYSQLIIIDLILFTTIRFYLYVMYLHKRYRT